MSFSGISFSGISFAGKHFRTDPNCDKSEGSLQELSRIGYGEDSSRDNHLKTIKNILQESLAKKIYKVKRQPGALSDNEELKRLKEKYQKGVKNPYQNTMLEMLDPEHDYCPFHTQCLNQDPNFHGFVNPNYNNQIDVRRHPFQCPQKKIHDNYCCPFAHRERKVSMAVIKILDCSSDCKSEYCLRMHPIENIYYYSEEELKSLFTRADGTNQMKQVHAILSQTPCIYGSQCFKEDCKFAHEIRHPISCISEKINGRGECTMIERDKFGVIDAKTCVFSHPEYRPYLVEDCENNETCTDLKCRKLHLPENIFSFSDEDLEKTFSRNGPKHSIILDSKRTIVMGYALTLAKMLRKELKSSQQSLFRV